MNPRIRNDSPSSGLSHRSRPVLQSPFKRSCRSEIYTRHIRDPGFSRFLLRITTIQGEGKFTPPLRGSHRGRAVCAKADVVGGQCHRKNSPHRFGFGFTPSPHRLPLKGGVIPPLYSVDYLLRTMKYELFQQLLKGLLRKSLFGRVANWRVGRTYMSDIYATLIRYSRLATTGRIYVWDNPEEGLSPTKSNPPTPYAFPCEPPARPAIAYVVGTGLCACPKP